MDISMCLQTLYYNNTSIEANVLPFVGGGVQDNQLHTKGLAELDTHLA